MFSTATTQFLGDWAIRSSVLILSGFILLRVLRVHDASIRLVAWTVLMLGSLSIPLLMSVSVATLPVPPPAIQPDTPAVITAPAVVTEQNDRHDTRFPFARAGVAIYLAVALALLLRLAVGLVLSRRLLRASADIGRETGGIAMRESDRVAAPVALGIVRPAIVLPMDWHEWSAAKLDAVLAHERSHILRFDPALQLLSAIHRALLWYSPLSWLLHTRIVRTAEEASDDAAVALTRDREMYAEVLLDFMQRGVFSVGGFGVSMARYGRPEKRVNRVLDGTSFSIGITRKRVLAILAVGLPLAYLTAAVHPQSRAMPAQAETPVAQRTQPQTPSAANTGTAAMDLNALGSVVPFYTVTVKPRVDGELMSVQFKEGDLVRAGQLLASIDPRPYQIQLAQAQGQLAQDQGELSGSIEREARFGLIQKRAMVAQLEGKIKTDQAIVDKAKLQLTYSQVTAPITGIAGLRLVDPGNVVHESDPNGILVISQLQPIAVVFTIPEDFLRQVRAGLRDGSETRVEAWNRENRVKIATGRLTAVDNQIDVTTGTAKLKAVFENHDGALFPNQFVNVHLAGAAR